MENNVLPVPTNKKFTSIFSNKVLTSFSDSLCATALAVLEAELPSSAGFCDFLEGFEEVPPVNLSN